MELGPRQDEGLGNFWNTVGLGLHFAAVAYNVYIFLTLGFLAQLALLPSAWSQAEAAATLRLVPGLGQWITPR